MKLGMFGQAAHPPGKAPYDCQEWDLQVIRWLDQFGYDEAWFGEHHALPWEPNPAPDILIAQALRETKRIRLGPGGICLPPITTQRSSRTGSPGWTTSPRGG
jgi:alkanesulfonate monooxygenase SsuD/methylene tetrahydromethanopterin reductase-like flavin-dependent oxidoreductase (luciferase family)